MFSIILDFAPPPTDIRPTEAVAFLARKAANQRVDLDGTIRFTQVLVNYGSYYDVDTSLFVCRDSGLYVFFANIMSMLGSSVWFSIAKDGVVKGQGYTGSGTGLNSGIDVEIYTCVPRTQIWVKCHYRSPNQYVQNVHSFFGGFRLAI